MRAFGNDLALAEVGVAVGLGPARFDDRRRSLLGELADHRWRRGQREMRVIGA